MADPQYEHGYRCRRCGHGIAFGVLISEDGQVKLWCLSCLQDGLAVAPHALTAPAQEEETAHAP